MRPNVQRRYTIVGRAGVHVVPNIPAVDARLRNLWGLLPKVTAEAAARIRHDADLLLDWRNELMAERGSSS